MILLLIGWVVYRTLQMTGDGLVKTCRQGPGAPLWAGVGSNEIVVRVPVPPEITTLEVTDDTSKIATALELAREATRTELRKLDRANLEGEPHNG